MGYHTKDLEKQQHGTSPINQASMLAAWRPNMLSEVLIHSSGAYLYEMDAFGSTSNTWHMQCQTVFAGLAEYKRLLSWLWHGASLLMCSAGQQGRYTCHLPASVSVFKEACTHVAWSWWAESSLMVHHNRAGHWSYCMQSCNALK